MEREMRVPFALNSQSHGTLKGQGGKLKLRSWAVEEKISTLSIS